MKDYLYAVDPGKKQSAVAVFYDGEFVGVWFASSATVNAQAEQLGTVVMERPRSYPGSPVRQNDLLDLTAAGMAVAARLARPREAVGMVDPQSWKGQVPKAITKPRIEAKLTQAERMRLAVCLKESRGEKHNLYDAIGLALFALKRAKRGCI